MAKSLADYAKETRKTSGTSAGYSQKEENMSLAEYSKRKSVSAGIDDSGINDYQDRLASLANSMNTPSRSFSSFEDIDKAQELAERNKNSVIKRSQILQQEQDRLEDYYGKYSNEYDSAYGQGAADRAMSKLMQTQGLLDSLPGRAVDSVSALRDFEDSVKKEQTRSNPYYREYRDDPLAAGRLNEAVKETSAGVGIELDELRAKRDKLMQRGNNQLYGSQSSDLRNDSIRANKEELDEINSRISELNEKQARLEAEENAKLVESGKARYANLWDVTGDAFKAGYENTIYGELAFNDLLNGTSTAEDYKENVLDSGELVVPKNKFQSYLQGAFELGGQRVRNTVKPETAIPAFTAAGAAMLGNAALGPAGALTGAVSVPAVFFGTLKAGSMLSNFSAEAGLSYQEMLDSGISRETALPIALAVGGVNSYLEGMQLDELLGAYRAVKSAGNKTASKALSEYLISRGLSTLNETAQEVAQESATMIGSNVASLIDKGEWQDNEYDVFERLKDTAVSSAMSFGLMGLGGELVSGNAIGLTAASIAEKRRNNIPLDVMDVSRVLEFSGLEKAESESIANDIVNELGKDGKITFNQLQSTDAAKTVAANERLAQVVSEATGTPITSEDIVSRREQSKTANEALASRFERGFEAERQIYQEAYKNAQNEQNRQEANYDRVKKYSSALGETGAKTIQSDFVMETEDAQVDNYIKTATQYYNQGNTGAEFSYTKNDSVDIDVARDMYQAGVADSDLKIEREGVDYESAGDSEKRITDMGGRKGSSAVSGKLKAAELQRSKAESRRTKVSAAQKVTVKETGISSGTDKEVYVVPYRSYDKEMVRVSRIAKKYGVKLNFIIGEMTTQDDAGIHRIRGAHQSGEIWVRADHDRLSVTSIAMHELFHELEERSGKGENGSKLADTLKRKIVEHYSEAQLNELCQAYAEAYSWSNKSAEEILSEVLADAFAGIDVFDHLTAYQGATRFNSADIQEWAKEVEYDTNQMNAPPVEINYSEEIATIKNQLKAYRSELIDMSPVANVDLKAKDKTHVAPVINAYKTMGVYDNKRMGVSRQDFGFIELGESEVDRGLGYVNDDIEYSAIYSLPYVAKRGKVIGNGHIDHKGRKINTITIAAPITINGARVDVAMVIGMTSKNRYRAHRVMTLDGNKATILDLENKNRAYSGNVSESVDSGQGLPISSAYEDIIAEAGDRVKASEEIVDRKLLNFLNNQDYVTTYKSMRLDDGKLHSPMAALVNGKYENEYELGKWYQAVEHPELIKINKSGAAEFVLNKGKDENNKSLGTVPARYNPYEHSSNLVLNDQFKSAYKRDNLVVVEMRVPKSELTSGYQAQYAKDPVGWTEWKAGDVAAALAKKGIERKVLLSRYAMPVRILSNEEVARQYKELLDGTDIEVSDKVVSPSLLKELEKQGVAIKYEVAGAKYSEETDNNGRQLSVGQVEYFKDSVARDNNGNLLTMYHGTNKAGFTVFRGWQYFTANKQYAQRYSRGTEGLYEVYTNITKPFDTRIPECRDIFENEFYGNYSRTGLMESGLPDWTDGYDLVDFLEENGYDFDAIYLDEGGDPTDNGVSKRGISYVVRSSEQVKNVNNLNPTSNPDIRYSEDMVKERKEIAGQLEMKFNLTTGEVALSADALADLDSVEIVKAPKLKLQGKGYKTTGLGFRHDLITNGAASIVGRRIQNASELGQIAQAYRDPRFETLRYFFLNDSNEIIWHTGVSSRLPGSTSVIIGDASDYFTRLFETANNLGATSYYAIHNHPSGRPDPSGADLNINRKFAMLGTQGYRIKYNGHVVINSTEFAMIAPNGEVSYEKLTRDDKLLKPAIENPMLGTIIKGNNSMASLAKVLQLSDDFSTVFYLNSQLAVVAVQEVSNSIVGDSAKLLNHLRGSALDLGGRRIVVATSNEDVWQSTKSLQEQNILLDTFCFKGQKVNAMSELQGAAFERDGYYLGQKKSGDYRWTDTETSRFSEDLPSNSLAKNTNQLKEETKKLQMLLKSRDKEIAALRRELTVNAKPTVKRSDVEKLAKEQLRSMNSSSKATEVTKMMEALGNKIVQGKEYTYEELLDDAIGISEYIVEGCAELKNSDEMERLKAIKDYFKGREFYFDNYDRYNELTPEYLKDQRRAKGHIQDYKSFKFKNLRRFKLTADINATRIDGIWEELQNEFGYDYFPDITSYPEMVQHISDLLDGTNEVWEIPADLNSAEVIEGNAQEILNGLLSDAVRQNAPSYADAMNLKLSKQKYKYEEKLREVRAKRDEQIQALKDKAKNKALNQRETVSKNKIKNHIEKSAKDLRTLLLSPNDKKHVPESLRGSVARLLEIVNLESTMSYDMDGKLARNRDGAPTKRTRAFMELKEELKKVAGDLVIDPNFFGDEFSQGDIDEVISYGDIPIRAMTLEQLETLSRVVDAVYASVRSYNKLFSEMRFKEIGEAADALMEDNGRKTAPTQYKGAVGKFQELVKLDMLTPEAYFHRLGKSGDNLFRALRNAQDKYVNIVKDTKDFTTKNLKGYDIKTAENAVHDVVLGGRKAKLTTAQIMEIYNLYMRGEQAINHMLYGGGIQPSDIETKGLKKTVSSEPYKGITIEEIQDVIRLLTADEIRIADALREFVSTTMSDYGNEASMRVYNYKKFNEENYWPIRVSKQETKTTIESESQQSALKNKGFTKAVTPNAKNAIMVGSAFDTFTKHVADMSTYSAYLEVSEDLQRILNYQFEDKRTVKGVLDTVFGRGGKEYYTKLLTDVAMGIKGEKSYMGGLTGNYKAAAVGANLRVMLQQPTAIARALDMIDPKYLVEGMKPNEGWKKAVKYAPIATWKDWGFFDINTGRQMKDILFENSDKLEKAKQAAMWGAGKMDSLGWGQLWNACELETKDKYPDLKGEALYKKTAERFTEIIDRTQVVDGILQRSQIMRSADGLTKMATSFMGEPTKQYNMLLTAAYDARTSGTKEAKSRLARTVTSLIVSGVLNAVAQSIVDGLRDDDEEKTYWEKWLAAFTGITGDEETFGQKVWSVAQGNLVEGFNPLGFIPFVKDVWSMIKGMDVERMDMESVSDVITKGSYFLKSLNGTGKTTIGMATVDMFNATAKFFGLPLANVKRDVMGIAGTIINETDNPLLRYEFTKLSKKVGYSSNNKSYFTILYDAYKSGNEDYQALLNRMMKDGFDEEKLTTFVNNKLKEESGVTNVRELGASRYAATNNETYGKMTSALEKSSNWKKVDEDSQEKIINMAYQIATGTTTGKKYQDKYAGSTVDDTEFLLFQLALEAYDEDKNGNSTIAETEKALKSIYGNGKNKEAALLFNIEKPTAKNNPFK